MNASSDLPTIAGRRGHERRRRGSAATDRRWPAGPHSRAAGRDRAGQCPPGTGRAAGHSPLGHRAVRSAVHDGHRLRSRRDGPDSHAGRDRPGHADLQSRHGLPVRRDAGTARRGQAPLRHRGRDEAAGDDRRRSTSSSTAARSISTKPDQCCFDRKIKVLQQGGARHARLGQRHPPRSKPRSGQGADRRLGQKVRPGEGQPAGQLDEEGRLGA